MAYIEFKNVEKIYKMGEVDLKENSVIVTEKLAKYFIVWLI